ncbi:hypothetical protein [Neorhodopirellula lusitana]|uniref:hypothetical protein n=1 Tax=Neorhodopirellula lusitana TaxID=445327 RepID=UPI00384BC8C2
MPPNLVLFLESFVDGGLDRSSWVYTDIPNHRLTLDMAEGLLNPIVVHDDGNELTVDLGKSHHTHFHGSRYPYGPDIPGAAADAVQFVRAVISNGVCVTVDYLDGRCIGSSHFFLDIEGLTPDTLRESRTGLRGGNIRTDRILWSGPV